MTEPTAEHAIVFARDVGALGCVECGLTLASCPAVAQLYPSVETLNDGPALTEGAQAGDAAAPGAAPAPADPAGDTPAAGDVPQGTPAAAPTDPASWQTFHCQDCTVGVDAQGVAVVRPEHADRLGELGQLCEPGDHIGHVGAW